MEGEKKKDKLVERHDTDASLRAERGVTDKALAAKQNSIEAEADEVVFEAREKADSVLSAARGREDHKLAAGASAANVTAILQEERDHEDSALSAERQGADAALTAERARKELARSGLLAAERQETDLRLEIERTRADEALTSREDFLAMVSHDLRSLLSGIVMSASLMKRLVGADPERRAAHCAEVIERYSGRMDRLIGDLIDVARMEEGTLSVFPEPTDVAILVRELTQGMAEAAAGRGIELTSDIASEPLFAEVDAERILQVLTNLVGNALKFTKKGGRIAVRVEPRDSDLLFTVEDTGEGIATDKLEQIFERFFQTLRHDRRGLGLGLYIAKSIVEAHGGKIWATSTPGRGSAFAFTLPTAPRPSAQ
ncbi:MAG: HAMP domain-containing histidine kinase [Myxococcales bacterium]|nr:HAMP domain-containing histidine kinase [Myxococcales bacterium]